MFCTSVLADYCLSRLASFDQKQPPGEIKTCLDGCKLRTLDVFEDYCASCQFGADAHQRSILIAHGSTGTDHSEEIEHGVAVEMNMANNTI